jgi:uncharacterized membrane protein YagU involved in acid resistance
MTARDGSPWWADAVRGAIAGGVAVWAMDLVTTGVQASQSEASKEAEAAAQPNGQSAVENLVDKVADTLDVELDRPARSAATQAAHFALGVVPGALYGIVRGRVPAVSLGRGLLYGTVLWAANDELLNASLGLSGPAEAYPADSHIRGLIGHLALGTVTDNTIDLLGG